MIGFMLKTKRSSFRARQPLPSDLEGRYQVHRGIHVLRVGGDDYEMGYQHGALLKHVIPRGPLPALSTFLERTLSGELGTRGGRLVARALQNTVGGAISSRTPQHVLDGMAGLIDGAGISAESMRRAATMPDTFLWLMRQARVRGAPIAPRLGVPVLGCTSAFAWGGATADGAMLHGRNFDYPGVGTWDREQAVVFHRPKDGQPYVSLASPGILLGGITAMNAAGITLVVHQHMGCDAIRIGGIGIGIAGDLVMRHAKNLDDARRILDDHPPSGCWTYLLGSADESRVLCYEVTPDGGECIWPEEETFGYSNIYLSEKLADREHIMYPSHWRNVGARFHRATNLLKEKKGEIVPDDVARILGYPGTPECRFAEAISVLFTIASVVFRPTDRTFWIGVGPAPTSNRPLVAFSLEQEGPLDGTPDLTGGLIENPAAAEAFEVYREAYEAYFHEGDTKTAREKLARVRALQPNQPVYHFVDGLVALAERDAAGAEAAITRAIEIGHPQAERVASFHLWRGRARDTLGRRDEAIADYMRVAGAEQTVQHAAARHRSRPWKHKRFGIDFMYGDAP